MKGVWSCKSRNEYSSARPLCVAHHHTQSKAILLSSPAMTLEAALSHWIFYCRIFLSGLAVCSWFWQSTAAGGGSFKIIVCIHHKIKPLFPLSLHSPSLPRYWNKAGNKKTLFELSESQSYRKSRPYGFHYLIHISLRAPCQDFEFQEENCPLCVIPLGIVL